MLFRLSIVLLASFALFAVVVFWPAGAFDWPAGWFYFGLVATSFIITTIYLLRVNPEVIEHRLQFKKGTKAWDRRWAVFFTPTFVAIYVVAGFDAVRYEWSAMPVWLWLPGLAIWLPGSVLLTRAMGVNPFFEKTVRIQTERGHHVIDTGPYRYVRHPGYLGFLGWCLSTPLLLGSWWSLVPALLSVAGLAIRTRLEDRTLHEELDGYREYASRVRYRLIPGVW